MIALSRHLPSPLHLLQERWGKTLAGTVSAAVFSQQGLFFPGVSRPSQVCGAQHQDDAFGGPAAVDCLSVAVQLLSMWRIHIQADSGSQYGLSFGASAVHTWCFFY